MKRKKLIPRPETSKIKFITSWGYSFQNGGDIPILEKGGRIGNFSLLYQEGGTIGKRTDRTGVMENKFERPGGVKVKTVYKGTRMDHPEVKSNYVRGGGSQTQETIDKNYQLMKSIREKHRNVKTQDEVVKMLQEGKLKPYEAQLLLQAIANERSDALGAKGFEGINYKKGEFFDDEESGLKFKIGDNGRVYTLRNKLNAYLQERAQAGDKDYKGWENLSGDMEYETGLFGRSKTEDTPPSNIKYYLIVNAVEELGNPEIRVVAEDSDTKAGKGYLDYGKTRATSYGPLAGLINDDISSLAREIKELKAGTTNVSKYQTYRYHRPLKGEEAQHLIRGYLKPTTLVERVQIDLGPTEQEELTRLRREKAALLQQRNSRI